MDARAASSLPVPVSPGISTVASVSTTLATSRRTCRSAGLSPISAPSCWSACSSSRSRSVSTVSDRIFRSASRRSCTLRRISVVNRRRCSSKRESVASAGKDSPSGQRAVRPPGIQRDCWPSGRASSSAMSEISRAASSRPTNRRKSCPAILPAGQRKTRSVAGLTWVMWSRSSSSMIASMALPRRRPTFSSRSRTSASARSRRSSAAARAAKI